MSDRRSDPFQRALDEARLRGGEQNDDGSRPARRPRVRAGLEFGPAPSSGGEERFGLGLDWTGGSAREVEDTPGEIAEELGLGATLTPDELVSRWRNFVWRNHPDRQPLNTRDRANARVAIANMLYDRARREFAKGP
jgi:hypothetical protein